MKPKETLIYTTIKKSKLPFLLKRKALKGIIAAANNENTGFVGDAKTLMAAFQWDKTKLGPHFWKEIHHRLWIIGGDYGEI
jgi:hypothetical protein